MIVGRAGGSKLLKSPSKNCKAKPISDHFYIISLAIGSLARSIMKINDNNQKLSEAAVAIGKGKFDIQLRPRGDNDRLGNAIAKMKDELQRYNLEMEHLVNRRTEELARSNEDLRQFAHVASHDMKEPLRKIIMFSRILHDEQEQLSQKGKIYLEKIGNAALRMSAMIEGVLAYSVVTANEPLLETVNPNQILAGVTNDLELAIIQKDAKISYAQLPNVNGIAPLLQQLFYNILNNALKFSRPGVAPDVTITATPIKGEEFGLEQGDFVHFTINDNGIGFESSACEKIFGIFSRLHSKDTYEGSGIGLALCRKIAERHGGKLFAESHEGSGATFHLLLPAPN